MFKRHQGEFVVVLVGSPVYFCSGVFAAFHARLLDKDRQMEHAPPAPCIVGRESIHLRWRPFWFKPLLAQTTSCAVRDAAVYDLCAHRAAPSLWTLSRPRAL